MTDFDLREQLQSLHAENFGWALRCCVSDRHQAEEVLQEVYLKVLGGKACFQGRSRFKTWLFAVIRTTALDHQRWHWLQRLRLRGGAASKAASAPPPIVALEADESAQALRRALACLSRRQQEALHLTFYHGLSLSEAAGIMKVSLGSARTHYERGKAALSALLPHHHPEAHHERSARISPTRISTEAGRSATAGILLDPSPRGCAGRSPI